MSNRYSRIFHHISTNDLKRNREITIEKIEEEKRIQKKERTIFELLKRDWRREIKEGMTSTDLLSTILPASDLDNVINNTPTTDAGAFDVAPARDPGFSYDAMVGTSIKSSGSGSGSDGGFDIGNHVAFDGDGSTDGARWCVLKAVDTTQVDFMVVRAIVGNNSNGGETPDDSGEGLVLYYKTTDMFDYIPINYHPTLSDSDFQGGSSTIIPLSIGSYGDTMNDHFVAIPDYARTKDTRFLLYQINSSAAGRDTYGITSVSYRRLTPLNVVVPLDSPEAISFVRVGTNEGDPKKRRKKVNDQLEASDQYTTKQMGKDFPGQGARLGDDDSRPAPFTPDDITPSPIGKEEVAKSFANFSASAAAAEPESEPEAEPTTPSSQTTMNPTNDEGEEINVKPVGGQNSAAVQGADAANIDAQNAQDDAQEPEPTEPEPTEQEPELDPEELKASEEEKQGKTPEEVEEIEREKFDNQFDKQTNFFKKQMIEQVDKLVDLPVDKFVDFSVGVIKVLRGINQAGAVLARLGGLIGGLSDEQNETLKFFETKQTSWEKMINDANIFRSTLTGRIEAQDYSPFQIGKLTKNLNPSQFAGDKFYVEGDGNFGISDTRHEYADDNIYVLNGKVYNNTDGDRRGVYATPLANMGVFTPEIDGIGRGYGQMIIPKDGSAPYFHYYDYNYFNMNSTDKGEVPSKFQQFMADLAGTVRKVLPGRLFNDVVNRFEGNLNTFNLNLKERVGLDGWPPGIHGATLHDFKIPVSDMSQEMQDMIANHPLSWTPERIANMSEEDYFDEIGKRSDRFEDDEYILKAMEDPDSGVDPEFLENFKRFDFYTQYDENTRTHPDAREGTVQYDYDKAVEELNKAKDNPDYNKASQAAYKEYEDIIAEREKKYETNEEKFGSKVRSDLYEKLVGPYYRAVRKITSGGGSISKNDPTYQKMVDGKKEYDKQVKVLERKYSQGNRDILDKYKKLSDEAYARYNDTVQVRELDDGTLGMINGGDFKTKSGKVIPGMRTLTAKEQARFDKVRVEYEEVQDYLYSDAANYMDNMYKPFVLYDVKTQFAKYGVSGDSWTPKNPKGSESKSDPTPDPSFTGSAASFVGGDATAAATAAAETKKNKKKNESLEYFANPYGATLLEKLKAKGFFNPKDIKPTFPENPPPKLDPKTRMHPNYGKTAARYKKLDPASANAMPPTGDPETDAIVDKQRTKPRPKIQSTFTKIKKLRKKN